MKLSILLISTFWVAATIGALGMDGPPKAPVHETEDEYFGTKIKDPYRWMENIKQDPEAQQWLKAQADFTRQTLDSMPLLHWTEMQGRRNLPGDFGFGKRFINSLQCRGLRRLPVRRSSSGPALDLEQACIS